MAAKSQQFEQDDGPVGEARAQRIVERLLSDWFAGPVAVRRVDDADYGVDLVADVSGIRLLMQCKSSSSSPAVNAAIAQLKRPGRRRGVPLVVVPFMGPVGREILARENVSWMDLSGNANIRGPRTRIVIEGRPNRYAMRGRPATPFAPKSSRIARWLLLHPGQAFMQRELAERTGVDPSQVSRVTARLQRQGLAKVGADGRVALGDRRLMLETWSADYKFHRHQIVRGHVPGKAGQEVALRLGGVLSASGLDHAFTGLAAAWQYTHVAGYRLATVFVKEIPSLSLQQRLDFVEQHRGSNVWLVVPNDDGVFEGHRDVDGIRCVHPIQAWLDLRAQPERAAEASDALLERILSGEIDG